MTLLVLLFALAAVVLAILALAYSIVVWYRARQFAAQVEEIGKLVRIRVSVEHSLRRLGWPTERLSQPTSGGPVI